MKELRWINISLSIIVMTIAVIILKELRSIFIPLIFSIFLAMMFSKPVTYLSDKKIPMFIILTLVLLVFAGISVFGGILIYTSFQSFVDEIPKYEALFMDNFKSMILKFNLGTADIKNFINSTLKDFLLNQFPIQKIFSTMMGSFANIITKLFLTLIFMLFMLSGKNKFITRIGHMLNKNNRKNQSNIIDRINESLVTYIQNKTLISLGTAICGMIAVWLFGVDFVIMSGLILFLLNYIPNFGSIIASLFPIIICFFEYGFSIRLIGLSLILLAIQTIFGNIIEPKLLGQQLKLSPIIILISLIFWSWVWGPIGMVLAVPLISALSIIISEFDSLEDISKLITGE